MNLLRELAKGKYGVWAAPHGKGGDVQAPPAEDPTVGQSQTALTGLQSAQLQSYLQQYAPYLEQGVANTQAAVGTQTASMQNQIDQYNTQQQNLYSQAQQYAALQQQYAQQSQAAQQQYQTQAAGYQSTAAGQNATGQQYTDAYNSTFLPAMQSMMNEAQNYDSDANVQQQAQLAIGDVNDSYNAANQSTMRSMQAAGVNPSSGAYQGMWNANQINQAAAQAAAATRTRSAAQQLGWNMQTQAAQLGQTLPGYATQQGALANSTSQLGLT
jgi:hypothetical protein